MEAKEGDAPVAVTFSNVSLLGYGDDHLDFPIFRCPPETPGNLT